MTQEMDKVNEQFLRVKRWLERFKEITDGRDHTRESDYYEDVVYAFFQNCHHLKDWIFNSGLLDKKTLNDFIESNTDLKICRDLCNGSKHLVIKDPSIDPNVNVARREYSLSLGGQQPKIEVVYWIHVDGRTVNAYDLAVNCVVIWETFLKMNNLFIEKFSASQEATTKANIQGKASIKKEHDSV